MEDNMHKLQSEYDSVKSQLQDAEDVLCLSYEREASAQDKVKEQSMEIVQLQVHHLSHVSTLLVCWVALFPVQGFSLSQPASKTLPIRLCKKLRRLDVRPKTKKVNGFAFGFCAG